MAKFRSKTVVVHAVQLLWATWNEVCSLIDAPGGLEKGNPEGCYVDDAGTVTEDTNGRIGLKIPTPDQPEPFALAVEGDWIVRGLSGELYPLSAAEFGKQYEPIDERASAAFEFDWDKYPNLRFVIAESSAVAVVRTDERTRARARKELWDLLVDARADAVRFVHDVRADDLQKARQDERQRVLRALRAFKSVGVFLKECDACAELFFTGSTTHAHAGH